MSKFISCLFFVYLLFLSNSFSKDLASMGATGYHCTNLENYKKESVKSEIVGFLNGMNLQLLLKDENAKLKIINYNTDEFAYDYLVNYCEKNPKGTTIIGVYNYYKSLPDFSD